MAWTPSTSSGGGRQNHGLPLPHGASFLELMGYPDGSQITQEGPCLSRKSPLLVFPVRRGLRGYVQTTAWEAPSTDPSFLLCEMAAWVVRTEQNEAGQPLGMLLTGPRSSALGAVGGCIQ